VTEKPSRWGATKRSRLAAVAAAGFAALAAGVFGVVRVTDQATTDAMGAADASRSTLQAQAARQVRAARSYRWTAVPGAAAYEFEMLRGEDAVYEATTTALAVELPARLRLAPGRYTWSVTPTYEDQSAVFLRRPVVEATFQVAPS